MKQSATDRMDAAQAATMQILVIGYGNAYRRDDGAGLALAERLVTYWQSQGINASLHTGTQLVPEMAEEIANLGKDAVVFVDSAEQSVVASLQVAPLQLAMQSDSASPSLGHHVDAATLLVYTAILYGCYPNAWLVTIPGSDFAHGEGFSKQTEQWLSRVPAVAAQLFFQMKESLPCMNLPLPNA